MRKRCFIIAILAAVCGGVAVWQAYPSAEAIENSRINQRSMLMLYEASMAARERNPARYRGYTPSYPDIDPYAPNSTLLTTGGIAIGLAGVLFLVGFIIGPPKQESSVPPELMQLRGDQDATVELPAEEN